MRISIIIFLTLIICFSSCNKGNNKYIIAFEDVSGLTTNSKVLFQGLEIGNVEDIEISRDYKVLATININKDIKIQSDSEFRLISSLFGEKTIHIISGKSNQYLTSNDTIVGINPEVFTDSSLTKTIYNSIDSIAITKELKRLNNNLEKLIEDGNK